MFAAEKDRTRLFSFIVAYSTSINLSNLKMARFWSYLDNNRVYEYFKVSRGKINIHVEGLNYFNYVFYDLQHVIFIKLMSKQVHNWRASVASETLTGVTQSKIGDVYLFIYLFICIYVWTYICHFVLWPSRFCVS